jgi:TolB protein
MRTREAAYLLVAVVWMILAGACGSQQDQGNRQGAGTQEEGQSATEQASQAASETASEASGLPTFAGAEVDSLIRPGEKYFAGLHQVTNGGENAEAYFSWSGDRLILQSTPRGAGCDQIFVVPVAGGVPTRVSTGTGRCTCAYFFPSDRRILFSSTHLAGPECPPTPDRSQGYVWPVYKSYDIFTANPDGSDLTRLTTTPGYDAEATIGADGTIVFTSMRDGDLDLYSMAPDGSNIRRLTDEPGYDGGAFFSPNDSLICYRAHHPTDPDELKDYQDLLAQGLVRPGVLEIYVMNADGSHKRQITNTGAANFCPFFHPSGKKIIFASNMKDPRRRNFDLYMIDLDGRNLEQITFEDTFDGFPMFSPDGKKLAFGSNRGSERPHETNIFVADWVEPTE